MSNIKLTCLILAKSREVAHSTSSKLRYKIRLIELEHLPHLFWFYN
jgi:hypothetical protein